MSDDLNPFRDWLKKMVGDRGDSASLMRQAKANKPQWYKYLSGKDTYSDAVFGWIMNLGFQLVPPGESSHKGTTEDAALIAKLQKECDDLRKERDDLRKDLIATQRMVIQLKDGQPPVLYPPAGQEKRKDTELRESEKEYDEPPVVQEEPLRYDSGGKDALNGK